VAQTQQDPDQAGLTGAVRADQRDDLLAVQLQADITEYGLVTYGITDILGRKQDLLFRACITACFAGVELT
jgi:hypothetical protein